MHIKKFKLTCNAYFIVKKFIFLMVFAVISIFCFLEEPLGDISNGSTSLGISELPEPSAQLDTKSDELKNEKINMVDERFELLSLVFRLAGRDEYNDEETEYQKTLVSEFGRFKEHPAVIYAAQLPLGYDAVFKFSVHVEKVENGFAFIQDIDSLVDDGRWIRQSAEDFLLLLNDFYIEIEFEEFYNSNIEFYEAETQGFIDRIYSGIDFEWFRTYVDPANLRCVYSTSNSRHNYGATVNDTIVYCAVSSDGSAIIHEFCHSFGNPLAHTWYDENTEFKKWCDDTIDPVKLPNYTNGKIIAGEYLTRAYNALYYADHDYALTPFLLAEKGHGFPHIEDVYAMITPYEKRPLGDDPIINILGVDYEMSSERVRSISTKTGTKKVRWNVLYLAEPLLPHSFQRTEVGNIFRSKTGDVLYVAGSDENAPYLLIDLGEGTFQGMSGYRNYSRIPLDIIE